jgi:SOS-response transcriptional repressor LexA
MSLTPQQHRLLVFIADRLRVTGVCPSNTEMMAAIGTRARGNVHAMVGLLEERGYLRRRFRRRSRCIEILRLPDDVSEGWLRTVSIEAIVRELMRRGGEPRARLAPAVCPHHGVEWLDGEGARECMPSDQDKLPPAA